MGRDSLVIATRYRCATCGNMTRFEVVVTRRVEETQRVAVNGSAGSSTSGVVAESIDEVRCGWCGDHRSIDELGKTGAL